MTTTATHSAPLFIRGAVPQAIHRVDPLLRAAQTIAAVFSSSDPAIRSSPGYTEQIGHLVARSVIIEHATAGQLNAKGFCQEAIDEALRIAVHATRVDVDDASQDAIAVAAFKAIGTLMRGKWGSVPELLIDLTVPFAQTPHLFPAPQEVVAYFQHRDQDRPLQRVHHDFQQLGGRHRKTEFIAKASTLRFDITKPRAVSTVDFCEWDVVVDDDIPAAFEIPDWDLDMCYKTSFVARAWAGVKRVLKRTPRSRSHSSADSIISSVDSESSFGDF